VSQTWRPLLVAVLAVTLSACAAGTATFSPADPAGFFAGIWHGWIAPFALIAHLFDGDVRIYEVDNTGTWYDVGFSIAVISGFGGISLSRRRSRTKAGDRAPPEPRLCPDRRRGTQPPWPPPFHQSSTRSARRLFHRPGRRPSSIRK